MKKLYKFTYLGERDGKIMAILHYKQRRGYKLSLQIVIGYIHPSIKRSRKRGN